MPRAGHATSVATAGANGQRWAVRGRVVPRSRAVERRCLATADDDDSHAVEDTRGKDRANRDTVECRRSLVDRIAVSRPNDAQASAPANPTDLRSVPLNPCWRPVDRSTVAQACTRTGVHAIPSSTSCEGGGVFMVNALRTSEFV
jgi:hypothetical protein